MSDSLHPGEDHAEAYAVLGLNQDGTEDAEGPLLRDMLKLCKLGVLHTE